MVERNRIAGQKLASRDKSIPRNRAVLTTPFGSLLPTIIPTILPSEII